MKKEIDEVIEMDFDREQLIAAVGYIRGVVKVMVQMFGMNESTAMHEFEHSMIAAPHGEYIATSRVILANGGHKDSSWGAGLEKDTCPNCGRLIGKDFNYCELCGAKLTKAAK